MIRPQPPEVLGGGVPRDVELRVPAVPGALITVRTVAGDLASRAEFPLDAVADLRLAVDEACTCLADLARPDTRLTCTFVVDAERVTMTASVSTTGPTALRTDTFAWRVLTTLADEVQVLAEAPATPGDKHRLALRMTMQRPADPAVPDRRPGAPGP